LIGQEEVMGWRGRKHEGGRAFVEPNSRIQGQLAKSVLPTLMISPPAGRWQFLLRKQSVRSVRRTQVAHGMIQRKWLKSGGSDWVATPDT
jgi:hypothetical protein